MLYAWIDNNGTLCTTFELNSVPEQYQNRMVVFENLGINDCDKLTVTNGIIRRKTDAELLQEKRQQLLNELNAYTASLLQPTDWVVIKLNSLVFEGKGEEEIQAERQRYTSIFLERASIRSKHLSVENAIMQATTIEELESITVRYTL